MKSSVSGNEPAIGASKNCAGVGWMIVLPNDA